MVLLPSIRLPRPTPAAWVLILSGILGFVVGVRFCIWQVVVETAQVVAGVVKYPSPTPFYLYHVKLWTVLHQICAVFLLAGVSETALSTIVSGVLGMVAFQGLSLFVYALSRDAVLAVGATVLVLFTRVTDFGAVYPISLIGQSDTYGMIGLSTAVLVVGLLGNGWWRLGGLLLGFAPAVHPSVGLWLMIIVGICVAWGFNGLRESARPGLTFFLAGCGATAVSLAIQLSTTRDVPDISADVAARYLAAFVGFWDEHRRPVPLMSAATALNLGALALSLTWLGAFSESLARGSHFLLRAVAVSAVLSSVLMVMTWIPPEHMPVSLVILMPGRLLNFDVMVFAALLIGLVGAYRDRIWGASLGVFLAGGLLFARNSMFWNWLSMRGVTVTSSQVNPLVILALAAVGLIACVTVSRRWRRGVGGPARTLTRGLRIAALGVTAAAAMLTWHMSESWSTVYLDRTNDRFFAEVAKGNGLLLTGGPLHLIQLRTRRPVLLDGGGLDGLPYSLAAAPELARILRDVYSIDFFQPPEEARGVGFIPPIANRLAWERYSMAKWRDIRRSYHVSQVVAPADWVLTLPWKAGDHGLSLYSIPE